MTKVFLSQNGPSFSPDAPCVFDGTEHVLARVTEWYTRQSLEDASGEEARNLERQERMATSTKPAEANDGHAMESRQATISGRMSPQATVPSNM